MRLRRRGNAQLLCGADEALDVRGLRDMKQLHHAADATSYSDRNVEDVHRVRANQANGIFGRTDVLTDGVGNAPPYL